MGMNPVTFRGKDGFCLAMSRLWIDDGGNVTKPMTCIVFRENPADTSNPEVLETLVLDENNFIQGIKLLFPNGELNL